MDLMAGRRRRRGAHRGSFTAVVAFVCVVEVALMCREVASGGSPHLPPLPPELGDSAPSGQDTITAVESNVNNAFVSSVTRQEFAVLNPDDVVAGFGTVEMLPKAELRISGSDKEHGMHALRHAYLPESQSRDYMRTIFIREPEGSILDFIQGSASRCPARNYGIRARVTDVKAVEDVIVLKFQQYDASNHIFIDEEGEARVMRGNFIRVALGFDTVGPGSLVTFMCKDYGDPVDVYVGWPTHMPVYRMDEEWSLPVKVVRMTTLKSDGGSTTVVAVMQHPGPPSDKVVDPLTQQPVDGPFMYVAKADGASKAYGAFAETLEGGLCSLTAFNGNRRPELHCNVDDVQIPEKHLKKAGTARKVKIVTAVLAGMLAAAGAAMILAKMRKAAMLPGGLAAASAGTAIGSKVWEMKENEKVLDLIKPKRPVDHEHLVFIPADTLPAPGDEENEERKLKLLLQLAEEKRREEIGKWAQVEEKKAEQGEKGDAEAADEDEAAAKELLGRSLIEAVAAEQEEAARPPPSK